MTNLEILEKLFYQIPLTPQNMFENGKLVNILKKSAKALDIIKQYVIICDTAGGMGKELGFDWNKDNLYLTQEEYDLLKEVLRHDK